MSRGGSPRSSPNLPVSKLLSAFESFGRGSFVLLACMCERSHPRRELLDLDDHLLADIGISAQWAVEEACKYGWIRLSMWRLHQWIDPLR
jgi:Domain of unknown function (DUF1127)